jgi:hypothetical protein
MIANVYGIGRVPASDISSNSSSTSSTCPAVANTPRTARVDLGLDIELVAASAKGVEGAE